MSLSASSMATSSSGGLGGGEIGAPAEYSGKASALIMGTIAPIEVSPILRALSLSLFVSLSRKRFRDLYAREM